jgi:tetratricopeptide (TPR) repeat protein
MQLGGIYMQMQQTNRAFELFDRALTNSTISYNEATAIAQLYLQNGNLPKLEGALQKIVAIAPGQPDSRYDLAALQSLLGKNSDSLSNLKIALDLNAARLKTNPAASDLLARARTDPNLAPLRALPEFQKIVPPN